MQNMEKCNFDPVKLAECFVVKVSPNYEFTFIFLYFFIFYISLLFSSRTEDIQTYTVCLPH